MLFLLEFTLLREFEELFDIKKKIICVSKDKIINLSLTESRSLMEQRNIRLFYYSAMFNLEMLEGDEKGAEIMVSVFVLHLTACLLHKDKSSLKIIITRKLIETKAAVSFNVLMLSNCVTKHFSLLSYVKYKSAFLKLIPVIKTCIMKGLAAEN